MNVSVFSLKADTHGPAAKRAILSLNISVVFDKGIIFTNKGLVPIL